VSELEAIRQELSQVGVLISSAVPEVEEWSAEWMSQQSLLRRQAELLHQASLLENDYDLEIHLQGDAVHGHVVEASFAGQFLNLLQTAVAAVMQGIIGETGTRGSFSEAVLAKTELRLVATGRGSFMVALEGPRAPVQTELGEEAAASDALDEALDRLMAVVTAAGADIDSGRFRQAISDLGGHRAVTRTVELSNLLFQHDTSARFVHRRRFDRSPVETRLSVPVARRLGSALDEARTTQASQTLMGILSGMRWSSQKFELEVEETGEIIEGSVALALRHTVRSAFDRRVEATVMKTTVTTSVEGEESNSYSLIDLRIAPGDPGFRLPGIVG
jgi:hypothetical protein